jgi:hypothetical protein
MVRRKFGQNPSPALAQVFNDVQSSQLEQTLEQQHRAGHLLLVRVPAIIDDEIEPTLICVNQLCSVVSFL